MDRKLRLKILFGLFTLLAISNLYFFLVKIGGFVFLVQGVIQLILLIGLMIWIGKLIWGIVTNAGLRKVSNFLTILAIPTAALISWFDILSADENTFQSDVKIRACYEGTMNTSTLYLRENGDFEDFNIGFFGYVNYVSGKWKMDGDTIVLTIKSGRHDVLRNKMLMKDDFLYAVGPDTTKRPYYYIGQCRGLN
jgi:hypothetical protein